MQGRRRTALPPGAPSKQAAVLQIEAMADLWALCSGHPPTWLLGRRGRGGSAAWVCGVDLRPGPGAGDGSLSWACGKQGGAAVCQERPAGPATRAERLPGKEQALPVRSRQLLAARLGPPTLAARSKVPKPQERKGSCYRAQLAWASSSWAGEASRLPFRVHRVSAMG